MSEKDKLEKAIDALEGQRTALGNTVVDTATAELRQKLAALSSLSGDKRQLVTVLFADVSGFTKLSERLDPEEVQDLLKRLWPALDQVIVSNRGHIDKHIGDAVMAVWGLSGARPDDAQCAVRAGLGLQRELVAFRAREDVQLGMRVGVNTGQASVSRVASTGEWNVIGDTVNVASRLEHAAELGSVLIGSDTAAQVESAFELVAQQPLEVKGKSEALKTFVAVGESTRAIRLPSHTLTDVTSAFVGREQELGELLLRYQRARGGQPEFVCVSADGGIGKSRLVSELSRLLRVQGDPLRVLEHACVSTAEGEPFGLLRALVLRAASATSREPQEAVARLRAVFEQHLGAEAVEEALHYVGFVLGLLPQSDELAGLRRDAVQIRGRAEVLLLKLFAGLAKQRMLLLFVEDLHHADDASLEFLARLSGQEARVFLVATSRPRLWQRSGLSGGWLQRMDLAALSRIDAHTLAQGLLSRARHVPAWIRDFLVERAGGNPFFCEELLRVLIERGVVRVDGLGLSISDQPPTSLSLPPRIAPLLVERLDRLSAEARQLLERAAVIGQRVSRNQLEALAGGIDDRVVSELCEANMLALDESFGAKAPDFEFVHALCHETTYEFTLLKTRRALHEQLAQYLAQQSSAPAAEVARHFDLAGNAAAAAAHFAEAGERARRADATELAARFFESAVQRSPGDRGLSVRCHEGLGDVWMKQARYTEAVEAYETMHASAVAVGDPIAQARAQNGISWASSQAAQFARAASAAERSADVACSTIETARQPTTKREAEVELANAWHNLGWAQVMLSDADQALAAAQEGLVTAEEAGARREQALCLNLVGVVLYHLQDRYDEAARYMEQALGIYRESGDRWGISCQLNNLGDLARLRGDFRAAASSLEEALDVARAIGHTTQELAVLGNLGAAYNGLGQYARAEAVLTHALRLGDRAAPFSIAPCLAYLCEALVGKGKPEEALSHGLAAVRTAGHEDSAFRGEAFRALGRALAATTEPSTAQVELDGRNLDAEACFAQSVAIFHALGLSKQRAQTFLQWAQFEDRLGEHARSEELRAQAEALGVPSAKA